MESHPIPQQISSYQFRLVGDMTLKQFFELAGGALASWLFYSLPIIGIIKWPLVIFSALLGIALAFMPLEDRPLERWIVAFLRSIYSPTSFYWQKTGVKQNFFQEEAPIPEEKIIYPGGEEKLKEYLNKTTTDSFSGKLEKIESSFLSGLSNLTNFIPGNKAPQVEIPPTAIYPPPVTEKPSFGAPQTPAVNITQGAVPTEAPRMVLEEKSDQGETLGKIQISPVAPALGETGLTATQTVSFSIDAAPPNPPATPNTLTGQVIDENRKIIEGAIMEIRDSAGRPVRALRSNRLGHFMVVTPLLNGKYEIITEKDGFTFEPALFEARGAIIPPIAIAGKKVQVAGL